MQVNRYAVGLAGLGLLAAACSGKNEKITLSGYTNEDFANVILLAYEDNTPPTAALLDYDIGNGHVVEIRPIKDYRSSGADTPFGDYFDTICFEGDGYMECEDFSVQNSVSEVPYTLIVIHPADNVGDRYVFGLPYQTCVSRQLCYIDSDLDGGLDKKVPGDSVYKIMDGKLVEVR